MFIAIVKFTTMLPKQIEHRLWKVSFLWGVIFFALWLGYDLLRAGTLIFGGAVAALEWTAAVLIGVSFAFGTFTYYTDFLDAQLIYRKYFGLVGYFFLTLYAVLLVLGREELFLQPPYAGFSALSFQLLCAILLILAGMTLVGHNEKLLRSNPKLWRNLLRAGYAIYIFWIPRLILLDGAAWNNWNWGHNGQLLPPPGLLVTFLAFFVIAFRLSVFPVKLWQHHFHKKQLPEIS
jgi:hypothetical protein